MLDLFAPVCQLLFLIHLSGGVTSSFAFQHDLFLFGFRGFNGVACNALGLLFSRTDFGLGLVFSW